MYYYTEPEIFGPSSQYIGRICNQECQLPKMVKLQIWGWWCRM